MAIEPLPAQEIETRLKKLPEWRLQAGKLHRELKFKNFVQAFGFMTQVAIIAERMDHHPEWSNVYSRVKIDLTTHEANGITTRDFELAHHIEQIVANMAG